MIRTINKNTKEIRQGEFTPTIDEIEIPNDGKPYGFVNGEIVDLTTTPEYIQAQKDELIGSIMDEQVVVLTQFDITWSRNVVLGKKTMAQMETARDALRQSYIDRINEVQNG